MMTALSVSGLSKSFGDNRVLDGISFDVPAGSVFGFIGANGAGKTTTMKIILGLLMSDGGEIRVFDERVSFGASSTNRHVGYLPDVPEFYGYMRPKEYLRLCGGVTGLDKDETDSRAAKLLATVGLDGVNKRISAFSRGMKQRLGMAQALLNEPRLLICDEPTSALDPSGRKDILDILSSIKGRTTVVFSTHILGDVERICDRVAVLSGGKIALSGTLAELRSKNRPESIHVEFASEADKERFLAAAGDLRENAESAGAEITLRIADMAYTRRKLLGVLSENDILPLKMTVLEPTVESLFLEVTR